MSARLSLLALLLLQAAGAAAPQQPSGAQPATARISGRVVAADTGSPVRLANVALRVEAAGPSPGWSTRTDADGRFDLPGLPAGRFTLRISKPGFVTSSFGALGSARVTRGAAVPLELREGQQFNRGDLALPRGGVIAGRVFDPYGDPAVDVPVTALRLEYVNPGVRRLYGSGEMAARTNDLGEFRVYGLQPGKYFLSAGSLPMQIQDDMTPRVVASSTGLAPTFYPGTVDSANAQPIAVVADETMTVTLTLQSVRLARISGSVTDTSGRPAGNVLVMLDPARADAFPMLAPQIVESDAGGRFVIPNVPPGSYRIDVESKSRLEAIAQTGTGTRSNDSVEAFASVPITVSGTDLEGLVIPTSLGLSLSGRVIVDGGGTDAISSRGLTLSALPLLAGLGLSNQLQLRGATTDAEGRFVIRGVLGRRLVRVYGLPAGWSLKAVRVGGADVTDDGFDPRDQDVEGAEVVVAPASRLAIAVTDERGAPLAGGAVIVFAEDSHRWNAILNRWVTASPGNADGRVTFSALPAGRYLAVALPELAEGDWAEPGYLERLRAVATRVTLTDGQAQQITLVRR